MNEVVVAQLHAYEAMVADENQRQNLVSSSTLTSFHSRHVEDSHQLLHLAPSGLWLDIGSGAGLPGIVIAIYDPGRPVVMVEPRARRVEFLNHVVDALQLTNASVVHGKVEQLSGLKPAVISARAVARLDQLFSWSAPISDPSTVWLFPKGRTAASELETAQATWQGDVELVPSVTDPDAAIVVARNMRRRSKAR